jgi:hypothetical protein
MNIMRALVELRVARAALGLTLQLGLHHFGRRDCQSHRHWQYNERGAGGPLDARTARHTDKTIIVINFFGLFIYKYLIINCY